MPSSVANSSSCACGAAARRREESVADLDALDGLDAHERLRELAVEAAVPVHVRAEPGRQTVGEHLDDAAERVAVLAGGVDLVDHARGGVAASKQRSGSASSASTSSGVGSAASSGTRTGPIDSVWLTSRMPSSARNAARDRAERDAGRGLAGARALEDRTRLVEAVLLHADEVGVARARPGQRGAAAARHVGQLDRLGAHHLDPLRPLGVADAQRDGAAEAQAVADAAGDRELVLLELHPRAAAVAELATREIGLDRGARDGDAGGQALHDGDEFGAVRFAGREHAEHWSSLPRSPARIAASTAPRHRSGTSGSPPTKIRTWSSAWCSSIPSPDVAGRPRAPTRRPARSASARRRRRAGVPRARRGRRRRRSGTRASPGSVAMVTGTSCAGRASNGTPMTAMPIDAPSAFERLRRLPARRATTSTRSDAELSAARPGPRSRWLRRRRSAPAPTRRTPSSWRARDDSADVGVEPARAVIGRAAACSRRRSGRRGDHASDAASNAPPLSGIVSDRPRH